MSNSSNLGLDERIFKKCNNVVVVTGSARSGTTILGKILHTFKGVEYSFEPPMLVSLFALIDTLPQAQWKLLYETYVYEEFLINALAGRGLNCNRADDSSIYNVKPKILIEGRLEYSLRKIEAERKAKKSRVVYKLPNIVPFLSKLKVYYPGTKIILITRKAPDVFRSILEKGWFADSTLRNENIAWPNRFIDGLRVPYWVASEDVEKWCKMNELHRIAYYYIRMNESAKLLPGSYMINTLT